MGIAYNAVAETHGIEQSADCMAIGDRIAALDKIAKKLGVKPLGEFVSVDASEWLDEDEQAKLGAKGEAQWFSARHGLKTVRALISHLAEKPKAVRDVDKVLDDLREYERYLTDLEERRVRWRIAILD